MVYRYWPSFAIGLSCTCRISSSIKTLRLCKGEIEEMLLLSRVMKLICPQWVILLTSSPVNWLSDSSSPIRFLRWGKLSSDWSSQLFMVRYSRWEQLSINFLIVGVIVLISIPSKHSSSISFNCPLDYILLRI